MNLLFVYNVGFFSKHLLYWLLTCKYIIYIDLYVFVFLVVFSVQLHFFACRRSLNQFLVTIFSFHFPIRIVNIVVFSPLIVWTMLTEWSRALKTTKNVCFLSFSFSLILLHILCPTNSIFFIVFFLLSFRFFLYFIRFPFGISGVSAYAAQSIFDVYQTDQ